MTSLLVAGGVYRERCLWPEWKRTFGSAGRAASAAASLVDDVEVLTPAPPHIAAEYEDEAKLDGVRVTLVPGTTAGLLFDYIHGLSIPSIWPPVPTLPSPPTFEAHAPLVLRFGMLEANARVQADTCVYDPQSAFVPEPFHANGSVAGRVAVVGNRKEIVALGGADNPVEAAGHLLKSSIEIVVVKSGSAGALVVTKKGVKTIPARLTNLVWPVGSGDVFAAAFTVAWAIDGRSPDDAADFASYAVADYVETMSLPISPTLRTGRPDRAPVTATGGKVYLAGPFFSMNQRWLVDEARRGLSELGMEVFSPVHEIGRGPAHMVAPADLAGLERCGSVLALLDGSDTGTVFEVGFARARGIPVYGFTQVTPEEDLKMIVGTDCKIYGDFVTCLHHCSWGR